MAVAGNKSGLLFTVVSFASVAEIADKCDPARYARRSACLLQISGLASATMSFLRAALSCCFGKRPRDVQDDVRVAFCIPRIPSPLSEEKRTHEQVRM